MRLPPHKATVKATATVRRIHALMLVLLAGHKAVRFDRWGKANFPLLQRVFNSICLAGCKCTTNSAVVRTSQGPKPITDGGAVGRPRRNEPRGGHLLFMVRLMRSGLQGRDSTWQ